MKNKAAIGYGTKKTENKKLKERIVQIENELETAKKEVQVWKDKYFDSQN